MRRPRGRGRTGVCALAAAAFLLAVPAAAIADHGVSLRSAEIRQLPTQVGPEPPLEPTPQGECGPGSRPETGVQGRVSTADHESGRAAQGYTCNTEVAGEYTKPTVFGTVGGFKVERYIDAAGHECAYYDTTLMWPTNFLDAEGGVNVMDMSDPAHPRRTASLTTLAMLTPHESLVLSRERGLLAAVAGNAAFNLGVVDVYDVSRDCRHPVLKSTAPVGFLGHESGMAPDGRTFYSASPGSKTLVPVDIRDPESPRPILLANYDSHGLSISQDGNRAYVAGVGSGLIILDTSEVQARKPNPKIREVARLRWASMSIPQNAIPITIKGKPYLVEIDEYGGTGGTGSEIGAGRIIDISDETKPRVISNLRLGVHQPENLREAQKDPGAQLPVQGYGGHYCNVPSRVDPGIVACSMIISGLRVFDIRDPVHPKEIAYFNAPVRKRAILDASNWAMSSPSFAPERGEIWYSDGFQGFYNVRVTNGAWPFRNGGADCVGRRSELARGIFPLHVGDDRDRVGAAKVAAEGTDGRTLTYCVSGARGRVAAVFNTRGRLAFLASTSPGHRARGVGAGSSLRTLRRRFPHARRLSPTIYRGGPASKRVFGVRNGRVRFAATTQRDIAASLRRVRAYLRLAGL